MVDNNKKKCNIYVYIYYSLKVRGMGINEAGYDRYFDAGDAHVVVDFRVV
jgi:hypothetical protein